MQRLEKAKQIASQLSEANSVFIGIGQMFDTLIETASKQLDRASHQIVVDKAVDAIISLTERIATNKAEEASAIGRAIERTEKRHPSETEKMESFQQLKEEIKTAWAIVAILHEIVDTLREPQPY